jgi:hypothetical protein
MRTAIMRSFLTLVAWAGVTFAQAPPAPAIISPDAGATNVSVQPAFVWHTAEGATTYDLQVSASSLFGDFVVNVTGLTDTVYVPPASLASSTTYYWRVRSANVSGPSSWTPSDAGSDFTTVPPIPSAPVLVSPLDGATDTKTLPVLTWDPVSNAARYSIALATDNLFATIVVADTNITTTSYTPATALTVGTTYYWRVSAINAGGEGAWSATWHFATYASAPPSPTLLLPANLSTGVAPLPVLKWRSATGTDTYTVRLSLDSLFGTGVTQTTGLTDTSITLVSPLDSAMRYYWQVQGVNSGGGGSWSARWSFTVIGDPPPAPALLTPADNAIDIWPDTVLTWETAKRASDYRVQLSTDASFATTVVDTSRINTLTLRVSQLARNKRFYWHVQGSNAVGTGAWSQTWSFVTVPDSPATPVLISPANNATEVTNPPTLRWHRSARAVTYEIQVAFRTDFLDDSLIVSEHGLTDTTFTPAFIMDGGTAYNWRIRAVNPGGPSPWSTGWKFTTKLEVPQPVLLYSPTNGTTGRLSIVILGWYASTDNPADSFHLQVSTDSLFRRLAVDIGGITSTERIVSGFAYSETYYWRVNGTNRVGVGPWSDVWHFSTRAGAPKAPTLTTPTDSAKSVSLTPYLAWIPGGGEDTYQVQVAQTSNFSSPVVSATGIIDTGYTVATTLAGSTLYYWRARAANSSGTSSWTTARTFTTLVLPPGATVALTADQVTSAGFRALWRRVSTATSYLLDVAQDSLFGSYLTGYHDASVSDTFRVLSGLQTGTYYYYRVRTVNGGGNGPYSDTVRVLTQGVNLQLRAMLAGPFQGDTMGTALRDAHLLPIAQPFGGSPWTYAGTEQVDSIPVRVVDWVLLELRSDSVTVASRRAAFVLANGSITDLDGISPVLFPDAKAGQYYIVVRHRNHLAVMSSSTVLLNFSGGSFDFTTGLDKFWGGEAMALSGGMYGLFPGDVTGNGAVVLAQELTVIRANNLQQRYDIADVNMNGAVVLSSELTIVRANNLRTTKVP